MSGDDTKKLPTDPALLSIPSNGTNTPAYGEIVYLSTTFLNTIIFINVVKLKHTYTIIELIFFL